MNSEQRLKIQWNFTDLVDGLLVDEITDNLYTEHVIEHNDLQRVHAEKTDRDKASCLINILITSENSFEPFLKEVESSRPDLAEKLKQTDVEEELKKEKEERIQFLCNVVRKRYRFVEDKSVPEEDMLKEITFEYWKTKKKCSEQEIKASLIECIQKLFPEAERKKVKTKSKKVWKYCNIDKTEIETSEEEEESCTDTESIHAKDEFISTKDELENREKHLPLKQFKDLKTPAMKYVLAPYFEKDGIESRFLEVFDREKIDGKVFADCDMDDLDRLFKDMPYGDKKRLFNIKKSMLKEESSEGPFLQIALTSCQGIEDTELKLIENWRDELLRRESVDKKTLKERCIIGLPWRHLNNIVKEVSTSLSMASKCQLPTSAGAFCYLKDKIRNELCDLEILSANECENHDICQDHEKLEKHRQQVEETFYRGGQVTWWNLHFEDDHVLLRSQQGRIQESIEKLLKPKQRVDDTRVPCFKLFHQPGAGGTTTAHHTLWRFRKNYRCSIVRKITDQTCNQIERLRCFEDLDNPKPPIILIDNGDEEKIQDLCSRLEYKARTTGKNDSGTIYCLLFLCVRRANLPLYAETNTVQLKKELFPKEIDWLKRKYRSLNERFNINSIESKSVKRNGYWRNEKICRIDAVSL